MADIYADTSGLGWNDLIEMISVIQRTVNTLYSCWFLRINDYLNLRLLHKGFPCL